MLLSNYSSESYAFVSVHNYLDDYILFVSVIKVQTYPLARSSCTWQKSVDEISRYSRQVAMLLRMHFMKIMERS